jgi:predicted amidohydrolase
MKLNNFSKLRVGFIQYQIGDEKKTANQKKLFVCLKKIVKKKPDLILLPEICIGGPTQKNQKNEVSLIYRALIDDLCSLAQKHHLWIYGSVFEKTAGKFYNTGLLINSAGKISARYQKNHLFRFEGEHKIFAAGKKPGLVKTPWGKMALLICYDIRFPELLRKMTLQGARISLVCAQWPASRTDHWITLLKARAIENQIFILACNRTGTKRGLTYNGNSCIITPWGELSYLMNAKKIMGTHTINLKLIDAIRTKYPFLQDAKRN